MEMAIDNAWYVTRDEARAVKHLASLAGDMELFEVCTHHLATRVSGYVRREPRPSNQFEKSELFEELRNQNAHVTRLANSDGEIDHSIEGFRYIYGPKLAARVLEVASGLLGSERLTDRELASAQDIVGQLGAMALSEVEK